MSYDDCEARRGARSMGNVVEQDPGADFQAFANELAVPFTVTEPGVYGDMREDVYHADPVPGGSLSSSGAKKLLSCPARFAHDRQQPPQPTAAMELGTAVHKLVLGTGSDLVLIDAENYRTKAAQQSAAAARAAGKVPLLPHEAAHAGEIADAVLAHPLARSLFDPEHGRPEESLFWQDEKTGISRRARLDWLPYPGRYQRRMIIPDLKTCVSASPAAIAKAVANFGYHIQAPWYLDGVRALGLDDDPAFVFVFAETTPPFLVTVAQLHPDTMAAGQRLGRHACERYRDCTQAGIWPGYSEHAETIETISLPPWALRDIEEI
jgi:PDDEXK-like domain of unknown function (DUF3799)